MDPTPTIDKINPKINIHIGKYVPLNIEYFDKELNYLVFLFYFLQN